MSGCLSIGGSPRDVLIVRTTPLGQFPLITPEDSVIMTFQPKRQSRNWARSVLAANYDELFEQYHRQQEMIAGLEHDNLVLQRGDRTNSGDDDFVELQRLSAENYNLRYEIDYFKARLASMQDDNQKAMEKSKPHHPSNDPGYHCECCGRRRASHGDTPMCVSVTDHWHPSAVDMNVSTQGMRARLPEMQQKYDEKHEEMEQCEEQQKNAVIRAFQYAAERRKAEKELEEAQSGSCMQKWEALDEICADLRRRLRALYEAIETNGEAVRQVAEDALDAID
jgi:hypothetical protein